MDIIDIFISLVLAMIMFGIGASLTIEDFRRSFWELKPLSTGLWLQMIFLPVLGFNIAFFSNLPAEFKAGLFIIAVCPGGTTSNFISYLVHADTALSISLTVINSFLILITIPTFSILVIDFFLFENAIIDFSYSNIFIQVFFILIVPVFLGVIFNEKMNSVSNQLKKPLKFVNAFLLILVFSVKIFASSDNGGSGLKPSEIFMLLPLCLLLHLSSLGLSYLISKWLSLSEVQATTIGIEVGLQNTALAVLVGGTFIGINDLVKPAIVYAMFSFFTTLLFAFSTSRFKFSFK